MPQMQGGFAVTDQGGGVHPTVPYGQQGQGGFSSGSFDPGANYSIAGNQFGGAPQGGYTGFPFGQQGQQPVQQQPHPTVPYGQFVGQPQGQQIFQGQQGAAGFMGQPQQQGGYPQGGYPQQGFQQQGQSQGGFQQPGRAVQLSDDAMLDGANVPPELRGRTFGQVKAIYTALATDWLNRQRAGQGGQNQGQQPGGQNFQGQSQGYSQQQNQGQAQSGGQGGRRWDWAQPEEAIGRVVEEKVSALLQPVLQQSSATAQAQALSVARQNIPDFDYLQAHILRRVAALPPEATSNPEVWINAARLVRGELMETGQYRFQSQTQQQPAQQQWGTPPPGFGGNPGTTLNSLMAQQAGGANGNGMSNGGGYNGAQRWVPAGQFFTESPTPPMVHELGTGGLSPAELYVAQQVGMTPEAYMAWKGGVGR